MGTWHHLVHWINLGSNPLLLPLDHAGAPANKTGGRSSKRIFIVSPPFRLILLLNHSLLDRHPKYVNTSLIRPVNRHPRAKTK